MGNPDVFTYMIPRHCQLILFEAVIHWQALGWERGTHLVQCKRTGCIKGSAFSFPLLLRRSERVGCFEATSSLISLQIN